MTRILLQPTYILHQRAYRESSLLLDVFTPEYGRVSLVAKGGRSAKSDKRALLQAFRPLLTSWSGRGDLQTLTAIEQAENIAPLKGDALYCGFYLNELLMHLLHRHDPHEALYHLYDRIIKQLAQEVFSESHLRNFEKNVLQELGYGLQLNHESVSGVAIEPDQLYAYHFEHGPVLANSVRSSLYPIVKGSALIALRDDNYREAEVLRDLKLLMRAVITHYLGDRVLKSRELFK